MKWAETSQQQHQAISDFANEARAPAGALERDYLSGINFNGPNNLGNANPQMYGLENKSMLEAIQRKSNLGHTRDMETLKRRAGIDAVNDKFNRLNQAAGLVSAEFQHNQQVKAAKYAEKMNRRAARASILGNILGIGGAVVGGSMGGPMGAMAGYGLGQGVGNMAGQGGI